jgi:hypothetical protein
MTMGAQVHQGVRIPRAGVRVGAVAGGPGAPVFVGGANNFEFIAAAPAFGGEMVTNAPYSAEAVTETQQVLADGNKISRSNSSKIYRDSQGRTRREQTISALGPWASAGEPTELIFINDPVAGVNYVLNTKERTAEKTEIATEIIEIEGDTQAMRIGAGAEKDILKWKASAADGDPPPQMIFHRVERQLKQGGAEQQDVTVVHAGAARGVPLLDENVKSEPLGKQMFEGVEAEGTRTTITIPAGQIGNERPIETVSESWFSAQLKTLVLSKQNDPRMGETTYKLTNIQLVEPLPSMFEVPADYTIQEGREMKFFEKKLEAPK